MNLPVVLAQGAERDIEAASSCYELDARELVVHRCMHAHRDPMRWL